MTSTLLNLSRRKFIIISSAAIASPLFLNLAGLVPDVKGGEKKVIYFISDDCIGCHFCFYECPASAIHWGEDKYVIDQDKCIQCGTCEEVCNISAASHK
ncbi:4Fe-4S binding protein [Deltaproteobacteria bacterium]|nr:4Fe-4S binding protein [Deltaproteobacteria bacterium]